jgi:hypothetical protein
MTEFGAKAILTFDQHPIQNDPTADSGSQCEHHHTVLFATSTNPKFSVSRRIGVIRIGAALAASLTDSVSNRKILPMRHVWWINNPATTKILGARRAKPDGNYLFPPDVQFSQ